MGGPRPRPEIHFNPFDQLGDAHAKGPRVGQHTAHVADSDLGPGAEPLAESSDQASAGAHKCLKLDAMLATTANASRTYMPLEHLTSLESRSSSQPILRA